MKFNLPDKDLIPRNLYGFMENLRQNYDFLKKNAEEGIKVTSKLLLENDQHFPCFDLQYLTMLLMRCFVMLHSPQTLLEMFTPKS